MGSMELNRVKTKGRLAGKSALITGGARGQGAVEAAMFACEGARVAVCDILEEDSRAVTDAINSEHGQGTAVFCRLDVSNESDWERAIDLATETFGALNVLVNNAGVLSPETITETTVETWDRMVAVNAAGPFLGIKHAVPAMRLVGGGSIVNVASVSAITAGKLGAAYHASKGAIRSLARSAAVQLAGDGIRVNTVFPGPVDTPMLRETYEPSHLSRFDTQHPMGRMAMPEEIAQGVLFLASDESSYMTGSELVIDGGWTAQ
jgi:cyclopentanol dehydrogenase